MTLSTLLEHGCGFAICWSSTLFSWITGLPNSVRRGWGKHNYTKCNNAELKKGKWMLLLISIEFKKESYFLELSYTWHSFALSQKLMFALQTHLSPLLTFGMAFSSHNWNTRFHPLLATLSPYTFSWKGDRLRDLKSQIYFQEMAFPEHIENCRCTPVSVLLSYVNDERKALMLEAVHDIDLVYTPKGKGGFSLWIQS